MNKPDPDYSLAFQKAVEEIADAERAPDLVGELHELVRKLHGT